MPWSVRSTLPLLLAIVSVVFVVVASAKAPVKAPLEWTVEDVQAWAVKEKLGEDVAGAFVRSGVEGAALLNINEKDVSEQFGISDPKLTKKLLAGVQKLRKQYKSEANPDGTPAMSIRGYRALNRNVMDALVPALFGVAPRYALKVLDEIPAHGKPKEEEGWFTWIFCPHLYIFSEADNIVGGLGILLKIGILCSFLRQPLDIAVGIIGALMSRQLEKAYFPTPHNLIRIFKGSCEEIVSGFGIMVYRYVLYPIMPWFMCDIFFWCAFYLGPLGMIGMFALSAKAAFDTWKLRSLLDTKDIIKMIRSDLKKEETKKMIREIFGSCLIMIVVASVIVTGFWIIWSVLHFYTDAVTAFFLTPLLPIWCGVVCWVVGDFSPNLCVFKVDFPDGSYDRHPIKLWVAKIAMFGFFFLPMVSYPDGFKCGCAYVCLGLSAIVCVVFVESRLWDKRIPEDPHFPMMLLFFLSATILFGALYDMLLLSLCCPVGAGCVFLYLLLY